MDIKDLFPRQNEFSMPVKDSEQKQSAFKLIQDAVFVVETEFSHILSDFQRDKIKTFMCSKTLLEAESSIEKQYLRALSGDQNAMHNVRSGMEYWRKLVMKEINYALQVASR